MEDALNEPVSLAENFRAALEEKIFSAEMSQLFLNKSQICLWVISTKGITRLLYGWILPASPEMAECSSFRRVMKKNYGEILRINIAKPGNVIREIVDNLIAGKPLSTVASESGLVFEKHDMDNFMLETRNVDGTDAYCIRNIFLSDTWGTARDISGYARSLASPSGKFPAFCISIFRLGKYELLEDFERGEIAEVLSILSKETGLPFFGSDAPRFGNLDFFLFPTAMPNGKPRVTIKNSKKSEAHALRISVSIEMPELNRPSEIITRCKGKNGGSTVFDLCSVSQVLEIPITVDFDVPNFDYTQITIWWKNSIGNNWSLWFEDSAYYVNEMLLNLGFSNTLGRLSSKWLREINSSKVKDRVEALEKIDIASHQSSAINAESKNHWKNEAKKFKLSVKGLIPDESGSKFFVKGWDKLGHGKLQFAEWLRELTGIQGISKIYLIDPYFDTDGIEAIVRSRSSDVEFTVLTNSQIPSDDDREKDSTNDYSGGSWTEKLKALMVRLNNRINRRNKISSKMSRADRLKASCLKVDIFLKKLRFRLLDVRRNGNSTNQIFHDRYIFLVNGVGVPAEAFHLSNSIQWSSRKFPLLITPIPEDTIDEVFDYVNNLLNGDSEKLGENGGVTVLPIYNSTDHRISRASSDALSHDEYEAAILKRCESVGLPSQPKALEGTAADLSWLPSFIKRLNSSNSKKFGRLWDLLGERLARSSDPQKYLRLLFESGGKVLTTRVFNYVDEVLDNFEEIYLPSARFEAEQVSLFSCFKMDFSDCVKNSRGFRDYPIRNYGAPTWGVRYAIEGLMPDHPAEIVQRISDVILGPKIDTYIEVSQGRMCPALAAILVAYEQIQLDDHFEKIDGLKEALSQSKVDIFRYFGTHSLLTRLMEKMDPNVDSIKGLLSELELAELVSEEIRGVRTKVFRIDNNSAVKSNIEDRMKFLETIEYLLETLRRHWPSNFELQDLELIIWRIVDVAYEDWMEIINTKLLLTLQSDGKLSVDDIFDVWTKEIFSEISICLREGDQPDGLLNFESTSEGQRFRILASLWPSVSESSRGDFIRQFGAFIKKSKRKFLEPFAETKNYSAWNNSLRIMIWLSGLLGALESSCLAEDSARNELDKMLGELKFIWSFIDSADDLQFIGVQSLIRLVAVGANVS
jgi:hypothetical protein